MGNCIKCKYQTCKYFYGMDFLGEHGEFRQSLLKIFVVFLLRHKMFCLCIHSYSQNWLYVFWSGSLGRLHRIPMHGFVTECGKVVYSLFLVNVNSNMSGVDMPNNQYL